MKLKSPSLRQCLTVAFIASGTAGWEFLMYQVFVANQP